MMKYIGILLCCMLLLSCSSGEKLDLSIYEKFVINNKTLSDSNAEDLVDVFGELEVTSQKITDDPSFVIHAYPDADGQDYDLYSVFLPIKRVFPGDHFEAWANNYKGKQSKCFILDDFAIEVIEKYK